MLEINDFAGIVRDSEVYADPDWYHLQVHTTAKFGDVAFGYNSNQHDYLCNILSQKGATVAQLRVNNIGENFIPFLSKNRYSFDVLFIPDSNVRG